MRKKTTKKRVKRDADYDPVAAMYDPYYDDRRAFKKAAEEHRKKVTASPEAAKQFLIDVGIITPKGNFRKPYRHLKYWNPEK